MYFGYYSQLLNMSGEVDHTVFNNVEGDELCQSRPTTDENLLIISQQCQQIEELKSKLDAVMTERDLLLCEVSRLKFELEIADLKRIHDDRPGGLGKDRILHQGYVSCNINGSKDRVHQQLHVCDGRRRPHHIQDFQTVFTTYIQLVMNPVFETGSADSLYKDTLCDKPDKQVNSQIGFCSDEQSHEHTTPNSVFPCHVWTQGLTKKGSVRNNGDVLKRSRIQNVYELSQDLLDKQIEMLERKYGGVKARNAALTIQRAFRHYTLLKKFAAITAMAKAEKRLSRRMVGFPEISSESHSHRLELDRYLPPGPPSMPLRSMSMRERRSGSGDSVPLSSPTPGTVLPRSHSGRCDLNYYCDNSHSLYYPQQDSYIEASKENEVNRDILVTSTPSPSSEGGYHPLPPQRYHHHPGSGSGSTKRIPPEVPKRTSSISLRSLDHSSPAVLSKTSDSGSLSSVQSSGSDSSNVVLAPPTGATWNKKPQSSSPEPQENKENQANAAFTHDQHTFYKVSEIVRKRQYRVGLNLFNKKPERGISYLVRKGFLENSPQGVARFLISRKGLSKQMIGEYLGNLQNPFNSAVLECFAQELDLSGMQVDVALRKFQTYFRMPGEAQKIERLMEVFSHRYCHCNRDVVARLRNLDTVFVLAFAIIMLNTDLHTPNLKPERRMKLEDFIKNLRGIDDCCDIDRDMLVGIYERVKANEFKPGSDHVTQVLKVQSTIVGKKPNLALPHRRLVCYCRLYEVPDVYKKERPGVHQREVFLFNDLLVITKILSKKKSSVTYTFRESFSLSGLVVSLFQVPYYSYGIRLSQRVDNRVLITFNARNDHDRCKFAEDMKESISEMDEMESLRIEAELERQKSGRSGRSAGSCSAENRDSGVADVEVCPCIQTQGSVTSTQDKQLPLDIAHGSALKRSALSNSLLDIHDQFVGEKSQRRGSVGSLDSGMSVSFQSTSASTVSRDSSPQNIYKTQAKHSAHQPSFLGGLFAKRERKASRAEDSALLSRSTQV